jgi:hypothetical protein
MTRHVSRMLPAAVGGPKRCPQVAARLPACRGSGPGPGSLVELSFAVTRTMCRGMQESATGPAGAVGLADARRWLARSARALCLSTRATVRATLQPRAAGPTSTHA